ncbi:MAG: alpha-galactosidase [Ruminococcaceae bacterium]|nr:alpha-galactosidase [Oscillospiraceae bacterium]
MILHKGSIASCDEQQHANDFYQQLFADPAKLPLSFRYGEKRYHGFDDDFTVTQNENTLIAKHHDGLEVTLTRASDEAYVQTEWVLSFRNTSDTDSKLLSEVFAADFSVTGADPMLSYSIGDRNRDRYSFTRIDTPMRPGTRLTLFPLYGKSTGNQRPYYRLTYGDCGLILALGWHGEWRADFFADDANNTVRFRASQFDFSAYLKPGESIRTPRVFLIRYEGRDRNHAINMWRRWYYDRAFYRYNGQCMGPTKIVGGSLSLSKSINEETFMHLIDQLNQKLDRPFDLFWVDAGWYYKNGDVSLDDKPGYWNVTGTWRIDESRFPTKMKAVTDRLKQQNAYMILWFEPERVAAGTELFERDDLCVATPDGATWKLTDMSNPEFRSFMIESVTSILKETGAELYRQDFNFDPLPHWRKSDREQGPNRNGITENHYITAMLDYYAEIHRRFPERPIDMCASGGMRNDMDVMRDSVMLTFTDTDWNDFNVMQNMRLGIFEWFSSFAGGTSVISAYAAQSNFAPYFAIQPGVAYILDPEKPYNEINRQFGIWEEIKHLMFCDYYPLSEFSDDNTTWTAWQFYDTEYRAGFAQFFRRPEATEDKKQYRLYGLNPEKRYLVRELNSGYTTETDGAQLLNEGLLVEIQDAPGCALFKFEELD